MTVIDALILGIVQGLTEFLPISSSGHLVLVPEFFNMPSPPLVFNVVLHVATLVAVAGYFFADVANMVLAVVWPRRLSGRQEVKYWRRLLLWLVIGSVPAAVVGVLFSDFFATMFESPLTVGIFLIVTSCLLFGSDLALRDPTRIVQLDRMRPLDALIVGCFQALAIAPGISRSGATITAGILLGFDRRTAARFSFLLSIPVIFGAFVMELKDLGGEAAAASGWAYAVGAIAAAISGVVAIHLLMRYVREHRLRVFAVYTALLGIFVVALSLA